MSSKSVLRGLGFLSASLLTIAAAAALVLEANRGEIDGFFGTHSIKVVTEDDGELFKTYKPDSDYLTQDGKGDAEKVVKAHQDLNRRMSQEGSVLLKNDGTLPLVSSASAKKKVTLLGIRSHVILAGSGMGVSANAKQVVQLKEALEETFDVNPVMDAAYAAVNETHKLTNNDRAAATGFNPKEASLAELAEANASYADSFAQYGDAAIVVLGRPSSEMGDYAPGADGVDPASGASTAMALTTDEKATLKLATDNFSKVIVLVNSNSALEIDEIKKNDKIGAILWVGHPGCYGVYGIADILNGTIAPSGHLYDTYAADSLSAPAMMNMGNFAYANDDSVFTRKPSNGSNNKYVIEAEGIYTGYRYYETRYEDVVMGQGHANSVKGAYASTSGWNYAEEVSYPFGYGLSYTTFQQTLQEVKIDTSKAHAITGKATVKIKNTGDKAAKSVVQLYGQAPYVRGGVEKASIQLLEFGKTEVIEPGKEATLTVDFDLQLLSSWDSSALDGQGSYILDKGNYYFSIGNGAHDALNNVLAKKGYSVASGMDEAGVASNAYEWNYNYAGGDVDASTFAITKAGTKVGNALADADWNYWKKGEVKYLSRADWDATYPVTYRDLALNEEMLKVINGLTYDIKTDGDVSGIKFNQTGTLKFADFKGAEYDDPRWEEYLNQMDLTEALNFILHGNRELLAMESLGFLAGRYTENGPNGIGGRGFGSLSYNNFGDTTPPWMVAEEDPNGGFGMNIFPSAPVVASTFSHEIAYEQGKLIGNDALFVGLPILWGPGMNTHRHPYNGRSGEYYSEDPIITGVMGMEFAIGALEKGLIAAPKHYAFNDQEQNRTGIAPYMEEQKAREIELRGYQIAFEASKYDTETHDAGMLGVMTSFSRIGPVEVTCSAGMLKDILIGEWGYNGYIVSDMNDDTDLFHLGLLAGLTSYDATSTLETITNPLTKEKGVDASVYAKDPAILAGVREAVHHDLYVLANSNYTNGISVNSYVVSVMTSWRWGYTIALITTGVLTLGFLAGTVVLSKKELF